MKKTIKIVSMLLVFSLLVCICPFAAAQGTSAEEEPCIGFHAPTIRKLIDANLACGNADEEFFHLLANAYLADPELLIETIMDLPDDDIAYLAKAIAYDLQKTNRQADAQTDFEDPVAATVGRLIALETADTENASLDSFLDEDLLMGEITGGIPDELLALEEVEVSSFSLSAAVTEVAYPVTAMVTFSSTLTASTARSYRIKFYKKLGTTVSQCGSTLATIPSNGTAASASASLVFNATGDYQVYAEVYSSSGTLLATSQRITITVKGRWHIDVVLPVDRDYKGTLKLYDASGTTRMTTECLGRSGSNADPSIYKGNTPTGECTGYLAGPEAASEHDSYGPYKYIVLTPISGKMKEYTNRSGFLIHGGDPATDSTASYYPLRPTDGCIRISNARQLMLQNLITNLVDDGYHYTVGTVSIREQE